MSAADPTALEDTLELLSDPDAMADIARARQEVTDGDTVSAEQLRAKFLRSERRQLRAERGRARRTAARPTAGTTSHLRPLLEGVVHTRKITVAVHVPSRFVTGAFRRFVRPARSDSTRSSTTGASQVDSVGQNPAHDSQTKAGFNRDVDVMAEQVPKVHQETAEVEEVPAFVEIDEEVDVAGLGRITPRDRAEHARPRSATTTRKFDDLAPSIPKIRQRGHGHVITLDRVDR